MPRRQFPDWAKTLGKTLVVAIAAVEIAVIVWNPRPETPPNELNDPVATAPTETDSRRFVSGAGDYSISVPRRWDSDVSGPVTRLQNRRRGIVISLGPSPGNIEKVMATLASSIRRTYDRVRLTDPETRVMGAGHISLHSFGTLLNDEGVRLRVHAAAIEGRAQNYAVVAFSKSRASWARATVASVFRSFRPLG